MENLTLEAFEEASEIVKNVTKETDIFKREVIKSQNETLYIGNYDVV